MKVFDENIPGLYPYSELQWTEGQNDSFSAASKGYKLYQIMNKGLI